jgi:2-methylisocitrate lyase-like PEP mutase family enzyme
MHGTDRGLVCARQRRHASKLLLVKKPGIMEPENMAKTRVETVLEQNNTIVFPGVFDALSAKIAERAGFPLAFITGYGVSATKLGEPDHGLLTQTEIVEQARQICRRVSIPIIVDADTGYGGPLNVFRTVTMLIEAGAAGCFLEDQTWPKKCGHMRGKSVIERGEYLEKIRAAVEARADADFFIVARTDAEAVLGLDEAISRVEAAFKLGANACFVEAPGSEDQLAEIGRRVPKPAVANMIEGGKTPLLSRERLAELGFQLVLYPLTGLFSAAKVIETMYQKLLEEGTTLGDEQALMSFQTFNELIGVEEKYQLAESFRAK